MLKNYLIGLLMVLPSAAVFVGGMFMSNIWFDRAPFLWFVGVSVVSIGVFFLCYFLSQKMKTK